MNVQKCGKESFWIFLLIVCLMKAQIFGIRKEDIEKGYLAQHRRQAESGDSKQMKNWKKQLIMKI